jgi:hypothetical protein
MRIVCRSLGWWLLVGSGLCSGCGGPRVYPVQPDVARRTLTQALDQWKSGATPDSLRAGNPEIVVQDFDWLNGAKLTAYEVLGAGEPRDANLVVRVKLTLQDAQEKETSKVVTYLVSTAPKLTVFRDPFQ